MNKDIESSKDHAGGADIKSCLEMAERYIQGTTVQPNLKEARIWYKRAVGLTNLPEERELCSPVLCKIEWAEYLERRPGGDFLLNMYREFSDPPNQTCPICGTQIPVMPPIDDEEITDIDLDLRCVGTYRSLNTYRVLKCSECGFILGTGAEKVIPKDFLTTQSFQMCDSIPFANTGRDDFDVTPHIFYQRHLLYLSVRDYKNAILDLLHAAWVCDDANDISNALLCRRKAISLFNTQGVNQMMSQSAVMSLIKVDMLRRIGEFDSAKREIPATHEIATHALAKSANGFIATEYKALDEKDVSAMLAFQGNLVANGDTGCHRLEEAHAARSTTD